MNDPETRQFLAFVKDLTARTSEPWWAMPRLTTGEVIIRTDPTRTGGGAMEVLRVPKGTSFAAAKEMVLKAVEAKNGARVGKGYPERGQRDG